MLLQSPGRRESSRPPNGDGDTLADMVLQIVGRIAGMGSLGLLDDSDAGARGACHKPVRHRPAAVPEEPLEG